MNSIKLLGTSNANPHRGRKQSGIILSIENNHYLFDCGDGIASAIYNDPSIIMNNIHAIFFTHRHADHIGGFPAIILLMHQKIKHTKKMQPGYNINRTLPPPSHKSECAIFIPGEIEQVELFEELLEIMHMAKFEIAFSRKLYNFLSPEKIYQDKNITVDSFPTYHVIDSCGFKITIGNKKILISGDISQPKIVADNLGTDHWEIVIIENAHFTTKEITNALKDKNIGKLIITHRNDSIIANPKSTLNDLEPLKSRMIISLAEDEDIIEF